MKQSGFFTENTVYILQQIDIVMNLSTGVLQARIAEWVAMPSSRGSAQPRNRIRVSLSLLHWQVGGFLATNATWDDVVKNKMWKQSVVIQWLSQACSHGRSPRPR